MQNVDVQRLILEVLGGVLEAFRSGFGGFLGFPSGLLGS